jgi:hypothetical protein
MIFNAVLFLVFSTASCGLGKHLTMEISGGRHLVSVLTAMVGS